MTTETTAIWKDVHTALRGFVAKRVSDHAAADDILQEIFLRVHRRLGDLEDPDRLASWLYQIARHVIVDYYRSPERRRELPAGSATEMEEAAGLSAEETLEASGPALAGCLRPMLERLPLEYREAVTLVELEGLSQQAAADRLGLSLSGMKSRVQRGRKQLKRMLDDCCVIEVDRRGGIVEYARRDPAADPCRTSDPDRC